MGFWPLQIPGLSDIPGPSAGALALGHAIGGAGNAIANIGNAASGIIPAGQGGSVPMTPPSPMPGMPSPTQGLATAKSIAAQPSNPVQVPPTTGSGTGMIPTMPVPTPPTTTLPATGVGTFGTGPGEINPGDFNSVYGVDTGTAVSNLLNSENPQGANSLAQAIIQANAPNVAKGSADLNTALAAGGISPSSSVSAIENTNYESGVQQQNLAEMANINLSQEQMQQQLIESLLPTQQQRQTDSSGWSIFGDILGGIGSIFGL